jgi:hypothetical protein
MHAGRLQPAKTHREEGTSPSGTSTASGALHHLVTTVHDLNARVVEINVFTGQGAARVTTTPTEYLPSLYLCVKEARRALARVVLR